MLSFHQKIKTLMPGCWEFPRDLAVSPCSRQERSRLGSPSPAPPRDPARLRAGCPWPPRHPELQLPFGAGVVGLLSKGVVACGREKQTIGKSANSEHLLDGACSPSSRWGLSGCWKAQERRNEWAVGVKARKEPLKSLLMLAGPALSALGLGRLETENPVPWLLLLLEELRSCLSFAFSSPSCRQGNRTKRNGWKGAWCVFLLLIYLFIYIYVF